MPEAAFWLTAVLLLAVGIWVGWMLASTRAEARQRVRMPGFPCAYRMHPADAWQSGQLRCGMSTLLHTGKQRQRRWHRESLDLGVARTPQEDEAARVPLPGGALVAVACRDDDETFELMMGVDHYTALRSWVEARPPGWNVSQV